MHDIQSNLGWQRPWKVTWSNSPFIDPPNPQHCEALSRVNFEVRFKTELRLLRNLVQSSFEYFQSWRFYNLSGNLLPIFGHTHGDFFPLVIVRNLPSCNFCHCLSYFHCAYPRSLVPSSLFLPTAWLKTAVSCHLAFFYSKWTSPVLSASPCMSYVVVL